MYTIIINNFIRSSLRTISKLVLFDVHWISVESSDVFSNGVYGVDNADKGQQSVHVLFGHS